MTRRIDDVRRFRGPLAKVVKDENNKAILVMAEKSHEEWSLTPVFQFAFHILKGMVDGSERPLAHELKNISITELNTLLKYKGLVDVLYSLSDNSGGTNWKYKRHMHCAYVDWAKTGLPSTACGYWCHDTLRWMADNLGEFAMYIIPPFQKIGEEMMQVAECCDEGVLTIQEQSVYED